MRARSSWTGRGQLPEGVLTQSCGTGVWALVSRASPTKRITFRGNDSRQSRRLREVVRDGQPGAKGFF
jgi:hypothetical protein